MWLVLMTSTDFNQCRSQTISNTSSTVTAHLTLNNVTLQSRMVSCPESLLISMKYVKLDLVTIYDQLEFQIPLGK